MKAIGMSIATIAGKPKTLTIGLNRFFRYINPKPEKTPTAILDPAEVSRIGPSRMAMEYSAKPM